MIHREAARSAAVDVVVREHDRGAARAGHDREALDRIGAGARERRVEPQIG